MSKPPIIDLIDLTEDTDMDDDVDDPTPGPSLPDGFIKVNSVTPQKLGDLGPATFSSTLVVSPASANKRKSSELDDSEQETLRSPTDPPRPMTPTKVPHISFCVEVPSPSLALDQYVKVEPKHDGLSEKYYPVESVERSEAFDRRYPYKRAVKRSLVSLSADVGDRRGRYPSTDDLETIQRASLTHSLSRLQANGPEVFFNIEKQNLFMLAASNFGFIQDYVLRDGVQQVPEAFNSGCECAGGACEPDKCSCLATEEDSEELIVPYQLGNMALDPTFLKRKSMIYECNHRCGCRGNCRFNVTQRGRRFRLEIFHTGNRGFGLRSPDDIQIGEYLDRYLGEVLTKEEADQREDDQKISYLFGLDFMVGSTDISEQEIYVVDGQKFGNATRFMNHSCNPNCKIIPVSINHGDEKLYYLAFFALRYIPAGTELTFDYNPGFDKKEKMSSGAVKCLCGDRKCRGQLWPNARKQNQQGFAADTSADSSSSDE